MPPPGASAKVTGMTAARFIFSLLLSVALGVAPVLHGLANAASAPDAAVSEHAKHMDGAHQQQDKGSSSCATHDTCNGQCCTGCTHSLAGVSIQIVSDDLNRSVMVPAIQHLVVSSPSSARDRPPRLFSL